MNQQAGSNPGPQDHKSDALTTRLPTGTAGRQKIFAIYALSLLMYTVASPDPNIKSAILR